MSDCEGEWGLCLATFSAVVGDFSEINWRAAL